HLRGVQLHLTLNTLVTDRQCPQVADTISAAVKAGVDAFIVQDWGVLAMCRQIAPGVDCHGSTQMSVHNLEGAQKAADLGCSRVVLARELSKEDYLEICAKSPIEIEVFGHGALCMCHSGQCYFSALVGRRSGNRGQCAQPCRLPYGYGKFAQDFPMSLKDSCLLGQLSALQAMGVASLKIEGRMKRPEYVAVVTSIYRKALDGEVVTGEDLKLLDKIFSREGFTSGYYDYKLGKEMFGTRQGESTDEGVLAKARATYSTGERPCLGLDFAVEIRQNQPMKMSVRDGQNLSVTVTGDVPEVARNRDLSTEDVEKRLSKLGGTPFYVNSMLVDLEAGLMVPASGLNGLRRLGLERFTEEKTRVKLGYFGEKPEYSTDFIYNVKPELTVSVTRWNQVTEGLLARKPARIYVPLHILCEAPVDNFSAMGNFAAILPRVILSRDREKIVRQLETVAKKGITHLLGGNIGHLELGKGFTVHGDFGLNYFNSASGFALKDMGFASVTASFELLLAQIRDLVKPLPTEVLVYGRLPMMITENCLISWKNGKCNCHNSVELVDRKGERFPLLRDGDSCRTVVYNGKKLWLLDDLDGLKSMGLWALRLAFSDESPQQVDIVLNAYDKGGELDGNVCTRGLYFRGVT
ncbi:MAG: U32 family peptidase, partial [Eubacteriales bacterium]